MQWNSSVCNDGIQHEIIIHTDELYPLFSQKIYWCWRSNLDLIILVLLCMHEDNCM